MSCRESVSLGAYVLGALEPAERAAMERHLSGCRSCREEVVSFAPLPGLLRHTPFEEMPEVYGPLGGIDPVEPEGTGEPPFEPFRPRQPGGRPGEGGVVGIARAPAAGAAGGGGGSGRAEQGEQGGTGADEGPPSRRRRILAVAAVFIAACASAVFVFLGLPGSDEQQEPDRPTPVTTLSATDPDTRVSASAALTPKAWGTEVELKLSGLPRDVRCVLVVHDRAGRTETGGAWASGYYGSSTIPASTSVNQQDIDRIDIVSDDGNLLVSLPRQDAGGNAGTDSGGYTD
jgi:hypothetical protein